MTYESVMRALSDPSRRQVLEHLALGPKSVGEIAALMPISQPAVSQHLQILKTAQLVAETRIGTKRIYRIETAGVAELRAWLDRVWDTALLNLASISEDHHDDDA